MQRDRYVGRGVAASVLRRARAGVLQTFQKWPEIAGSKYGELAKPGERFQRLMLTLTKCQRGLAKRTKIAPVGGSSRSPATPSHYFLRQSAILRDSVRSLVAGLTRMERSSGA